MSVLTSTDMHITRSSTRLHAPPGGHSSISFGAGPSDSSYLRNRAAAPSYDDSNTNEEYYHRQPAPGQSSSTFGDSVENEMTRMQEELRVNTRYDPRTDSGYCHNDAPSPLAQALTAQKPSRKFIPRPASGADKGKDIFGQENSNQTVYTKPDSPNRDLRLLKKQQQQDYARDLAAAAQYQQPVGDMRRNYHVSGESILDTIGRKSSPPSPVKPQYNPDVLTSRAQKRAAQAKYAEQIKLDSHSRSIEQTFSPASRSGSYSDHRSSDPSGGYADSSLQYGQGNKYSARAAQSSYREQLDIDQRQKSTGRDSERGNPRSEQQSGGSLFDSLSRDQGSKRDKQQEYARLIREAQSAAPIPEDYKLLRSRTTLYDDLEDSKYTAFKRTEHSEATPQRRAKSSSVDYGPPLQEYSVPIDVPHGYRSAPAKHDKAECYYSNDYSNDYQAAPSRNLDPYAYANKGSAQSGSNESSYDRFNAQGEESYIGGYSAPSRKVQDFKERQRAYHEIESDHRTENAESTLPAPSVYDSQLARSKDEEWKKKKLMQEAYAREILASSNKAPIAAPRVSLLHDNFEGNGLPGGYRIRGTSTGGGVTQFRLG